MDSDIFKRFFRRLSIAIIPSAFTGLPLLRLVLCDGS